MRSTMNIFALTALLAVARANSDTLDVVIQDRAFVPETLSVNTGDVVRWTNQDDMPHTVTAKGKFDSGKLMLGKTFVRKFEKAGSFPYGCTIHKSMKAIVEAKTTSAAAPSDAASKPAQKAPAPAPAPPAKKESGGYGY